MLFNDLYNESILKCDKAVSIIGMSNLFFDNKVSFSSTTYSSDIHDCVINGSFLMMFTALEYYLENSFICYMLGQPGINKNVPNCYVNPNTEDHALNIIKGIGKHSDFTNRDTTIRLAKNFFDNGGPYTSLNTHSVVFEELKKIRNAITHISPESKKVFDDMVRNKITYLPSSTTPASFLTTFEKKIKTTYFTYYHDSIIMIIDAIANP